MFRLIIEFKVFEVLECFRSVTEFRVCKVLECLDRLLTSEFVKCLNV